MSGTSKGTFDLSAKRRALLEALLGEQGIKAPKAERIPRREGGGPAPLSFAQRRLWFFDQFEPGNPAYNLVSTVSLRGSGGGMKNVAVTCVAGRLKRLPARHRIAHLRALIGLQPEGCGRRDELSELLRDEISDASSE